MKNFIAILLLFCTLNVLAQGEANNWYFGQNAGINFNSGNPVSISGSLNTYEGCSSFSDKNGNLLFYSDGTTVWDKNNTPMPNGNGSLKGHSSSTQSAIIVPNPADNNLFYIFTVGAIVNNIGEFGFHCYTVDMTQNYGLGDIVGTSIDLSVGRNEDWSEKVASVKGNSCNTFWIISLVQNTFYSYKVDTNGLHPTPVKSVVDYYSGDRRGYLKVSPDGKKLASATFTQYYDNTGVNILGNGKLHLYSFNDLTGEVSNNGIEVISNTALDGSPYGVEFSPQSTKLYCSTFDGSNNKLYQFDLENANNKTLIKSQIGYRGALQLAPNGKIYATVPESYDVGTKYLDAINSPDEIGTNCNYQLNALDLGFGSAMQGLPPFIASLLLPIEITSLENNNQIITNQKVKLCVGSDYTFNAEYLPGNPSYSWTHNDSLVSSISSLTLTNIQPNKAGIYKLEVNLIDDCGFPIIYKGNFEVEVFYPPVISNSFIYDQCDIDNNSTDGITQFNLTTKIEEITQNDPNLDVLFFKTQTDLDSNNPILDSENYTSASNPNIFVKLTNNLSGCFTTGKMALNVYPTSLDLYANYYECENDISLNNDLKSLGSGNATFDFEVKRQEIEAVFSDPSIEVEFYQNTSDAQLQINSLQGIIDFPPKEIIVRISNKLSRNCISVGKFDLVVNQIPVPNGSHDDIILCVSNPRDNPQLFTTYLDGKTLNPTDTYQWYFNNNSISGATNSFYEANAEGIYKVEVAHKFENNIINLNDDSYCVGFNTFKVIESNPATISQNDITITDDSNNNSIKINNTNHSIGIGDYEFMLVDFIGVIEYPYQEDPFFENLSPGFHTIYVQDKNGCDIASIEVSVIGYPKFFTPNNDGQNDTWNVLGVNENFFQQATVYIFNRFGKLITEIGLYSEGWNGTFNGNYLPATDYWFSVELVDLKGNIMVKKGHFSLIRR